MIAVAGRGEGVEVVLEQKVMVDILRLMNDQVLGLDGLARWPLRLRWWLIINEPLHPYWQLQSLDALGHNV